MREHPNKNVALAIDARVPILWQLNPVFEPPETSGARPSNRPQLRSPDPGSAPPQTGRRRACDQSFRGRKGKKKEAGAGALLAVEYRAKIRTCAKRREFFILERKQPGCLRKMRSNQFVVEASSFPCKDASHGAVSIAQQN